MDVTPVIERTYDNAPKGCQGVALSLWLTGAGKTDVLIVMALQRRAADLREAIHRVNVDWDEVARTCGDPKCDGDCRWVRAFRDAS